MKKLIFYPILIFASGCELMELEEETRCKGQEEAFCEGLCVNLTSEEHCGSCGKKCDGGWSCLQKEGKYGCYLPDANCPVDQEFCDDRCVHIDTEEHCGGCSPCDASEECKKHNDNYRCVPRCPKPSMLCAYQCLPQSVNSCGSCYNACLPGQICAENDQGYRCEDADCLIPKVLTAEGFCVLPNTPHHCGDKAEPCPEDVAECIADKAREQHFMCLDRCKNGKKDQGEVFVDCGGRCKACYECRTNDDCAKGEFCDSAKGYKCSKQCVPDNGKTNSASKDCMPGQICRADGRCASEHFVTEWRLYDPQDLSIRLFHDGKGACDFDVDWGDGKKEHIENCSPEKLELRYASPGIYLVSVDGIYDGWGGDRTGSVHQLTGVIHFGPVGLSHSAFAYCTNLDKIPKEEVPDASKWKDASSLFLRADAFNQNIEHWDLSNVTNMASMFQGATSFNQPLNDWNVSNVTNMTSIFQGATAFDGLIENWKLSGVTDTDMMFYEATSFNQPIGKWDVSNVKNFSWMFKKAESFNQPLDQWVVSQATNMAALFAGAKAFNQPLNDWIVSNVTNMALMFNGAESFNQPLDKWNVSKVYTMSRMFQDAKKFNQDLSSWRAKNNANMDYIFSYSGLSRENYCQMLKQAFWKQFQIHLGISYPCS